MTRSQSGHDVEEAGLNALVLPRKTQIYYVAVAPLGTVPKIRVPTGRFKDVLFPSNGHLQPPTANVVEAVPSHLRTTPSSSQTFLDNSEPLPNPLPSTSNRPDTSEPAPQTGAPSGGTGGRPKGKRRKET